MKQKIFETEIGGRRLVVETGVLAPQADGAVRVSYGDTTVLVSVVMSDRVREGVGFFPLMVDYEEKFYAAGRIKGSRFIKREGRPSDEAVSTARAIDRALRPRFDHRIRNDIQVIVTALSIDEENDPDVLAIFGASVALTISDIPWKGSLGAVRLGGKNDNANLMVNPTYEERKDASFEALFTGDEETINMMEIKASETEEDRIVEAGRQALEVFKKQLELQKKIAESVGSTKRQLVFVEPDSGLVSLLKKFLQGRLEKAIYRPLKVERLHELRELKKQCLEKFSDGEDRLVEELFEQEIDAMVHQKTLKEGVRPDGRKTDQLREVSVQVGILPRVHGSALFSRGLTQALSVVTLAGPGEEQVLDGMEIVGTKRYLHHYNFPPFSVGEVGVLRGPGRREIGHGMLAEKAIEPLVPNKDEFPYTIRVVTEILSSNGSSSMAAVCGSSLALFDAGVPLKTAAAGIAMGLMSDEEGNYKILTDIQGPEDHHGDMDLKVAGTHKGITAIQMDVKIQGITPQIFKAVLQQAKKARLEILEVMNAQIAKPRPSVSHFAPKVAQLKIASEKIRELIGPGGKTINSIIDSSQVKSIDIEDDGVVYVTADDEERLQDALTKVKDITKEILPGEVLEGPVTRTMTIGAFVALTPNQEGMIHISRLAPYRVGRVEDVVHVGDKVSVKVIEIDNQGRYNLQLIKVIERKDKKAGASPPASQSQGSPRHAQRTRHPRRPHK